MIFTWFLWIISVFILFMVFMNFIIAVICESFTNVLKYKEAHDYLQRVKMIYELETHFSIDQLENDMYFPQILIVRSKKGNKSTNSTWKSWLNNVNICVK